MKNKKKIIVFASGSGTNFINLFDTICNGKIISESDNITNLELGKTIDIHNTLSKNLLNK